jgi:hypothetical protein
MKDVAYLVILAGSILVLAVMALVTGPNFAWQLPPVLIGVGALAIIALAVADHLDS